MFALFEDVYYLAAKPQVTFASLSSPAVMNIRRLRRRSLETRDCKQRKATLEEYQQTFLQVPRIDDRKPVFVSSDVRDRLDRVVRILGERRMSVSGITENIVRHHLSLYEEDFEAWRKL